MNLHFCMMTAPTNILPLPALEELGITFQLATAHSMSDCIRFWCCENVPDRLPPYLTEFKTDPYAHVGHGLTTEDAEYISNYFKEKNK